jgi:predicted permease
MIYKIISYFSIIALGYFLKKVGFLSEKDGSVLSRLIIYVTLPVVIVNAITSVKLQPSLLFLTLFGSIAAFFILVFGLFFFSKSNLPNKTKGSLSLTLCGLNLAIFAYPFAQAMWSNRGLTYMAMFDIGNALIIYTLGYSVALKYSSEGFNLTTVVKKLVTFPPLIAFEIALLINFNSISIPSSISTMMSPVSSANAFLSMITIGLYLNFKRISREMRYMLIGITIKYAVGLGVGIALWYLSRLIAPTDHIASTVVLVSSLMPTPLLSLIYSIEKKLDPEVAGGMVTITVVISSLILFFVGM